MVIEEKKVILLAPTPPPAGGIARWTERMLNTELEDNWKIELVDEKVIGGREVFGSKTRKNILVEVKRCMNIWKNLNIKLQEKNAFVVHSCIPSETLSMLREYVCACITKHYKKKFIIHFRCTVPNTTKGIIGNFLLKLLCKKSDRIIVLNNQSAEYLKTLTKTDLEIIPNFINISEMDCKREIKENINKIIYVGGVIKEKGCLDIIKVAENFPEIEFRLVGKADENVKNIAQNNKNIVLVGTKNSDEIKKELNSADVFLFLSYYKGEGFSNALAEAMAKGLPCIVTDWAANADMIENKGGIVVPCKSPDKVIDAIKKMKDPNIRKIQSEFNINKVKMNYSDIIVIKRYVNVYEACLKEYQT